MKHGKLWLAIALILVIGCWTTSHTRKIYDLTAEPERVEVSVDTSNSLKSAAEQERNVWESELQRILDILISQLPEDEKTELIREQRIWMKDRENTALAASGKKRGSSLEELEYIISYSEATRDRTYELAEQYDYILAETD